MDSKLSPLPPLLIILFTTCTLLSSHVKSQNDDRQAYIVYMGHRPEDLSMAPRLHASMVQEVVNCSKDFASEVLLLHSYKKSFHGFVAKLTEDEATRMAGKEGVVSVFPNEKLKLHTTRSWDFVGLTKHARRTRKESDVIIGVIDTGIWPESKSFNDAGLGPPPQKWKGGCHDSNFTCNNKIIGVRYYNIERQFSSQDIESARDPNGHGTLISSIAAGGLVSSASLFGFASGTARGAVPSARIAVYKACWERYLSCGEADVLAAFDDAIADGVDIITISAGWPLPRPYFNDSISIGSFHALKHGILTSTSAGNNGPSLLTLSNYAPWHLSVAASTIDRKFLTKVLLGNNKSYQGVSINPFDLEKKIYPLLYGGAVPNTKEGFNSSISRQCLNGSLDARKVRNKIVFCEASLSPPEVGLVSGAAGIVFRADALKDVAFPFTLPASHVGSHDGKNIISYISSAARNSTATIFRTETVHDESAPLVGSFSSRGPNPITLDILKPDFSAPGVNIIAAWSPLNPPSQFEGDKRKVNFYITSGTSLSCPHATGAAAYIKSFHPNWSPAAIKSALITTARPMSPELNPDAEFAYGAGHIDPVKAVNPGLIYDTSVVDYVQFLCGQGYDTQKLQLIIKDEHVNCSKLGLRTAWDINYPSFSFATYAPTSVSRIFLRTVTNVGAPNSTYRAKVTAPKGLNMTVNPSTLSFTSVGQMLSFELTIEGDLKGQSKSASLIWDDGSHQVRSPIVVFVPPASKNS